MSKSDDIAISVKNVSKAFRLPHEKQSSVKGMFLSVFHGKRTYEHQQVLKDISFDIKKGEFFGIVGRNGSGKSTLLKLLAGIYSPDKGQIKLNGRLTPFIELGVGFNPELTGRENVFLNGALLGFSRKEMEAMYDEIVEFAELEKFMDQKLKNYSSGMQVRLAFSIAIRADSDILLIDEVLAVGDQSFQEKCFDFFSKIKKSSQTVVFVTHDMSNVERFCDRVFVLDRLPKNTGVFSVPDAVSHYHYLNHASAGSEIDHNGQRKKGDIYIDAVQFLDEKGKRGSKFDQFEPLTIRVKLGATQHIRKNGSRVTVGISIQDKENINLTGPNSLKQDFNISSDHIDYRINKIPFTMGEYNVTVALFNEDATVQYDLINKGLRFFVNSKEAQHGKIVLDAEWIAS